MKLIKYAKKLNNYYNTLEQVGEKGEYPGKIALYTDFFFSMLIHGSTIADYFQYRFWEKSGIAKKQFMTARKNNTFYKKVNQLAARGRLNHKAEFNRDFSKYLKRDTIAVPGCSEEEVRAFCQEHQTFFVKPCKLGAGAGIKRYNWEDVAGNENFYHELSKGEYVLEECIQQDEHMASIHPQSVNTVRVVTFFDEEKVTLIGAVLRCGAGDSYIDNHSAGGYTCIIDLETGIIVSGASSKWQRNVMRHPDTGVLFPGFQIPNWEKAIEMVKEAAASLKGVHYAGWDVAFIPGDVCLIEANPSGDPSVLQEPLQVGYKKRYDWMLEQLGRI